MFTAYDDQHKRVNANDFKSDKKVYCPSCREEVVFKHGQIIQAHFSHKNKSECQSFSEGETPEHLEGKLFLYRWLKKEGLNVELEAFLPLLKQRPDLLVSCKGSKIAVEFQCSPISKEVIANRTNGYKENGYQVVWILGRNLRSLGEVSSRHYAYMSVNEEGNYYLFQLNQKRETVEVLTDFAYRRKCILYTKKSFTFSNSMKDVISALVSKPKSTSFYKDDVAEQKKQLYRLSYYQNDKSRRFFQLIYESGIGVDHLPIVLYYTVSNEWMLSTFSYQWKFLILRWLNDHATYSVLTSKSIKATVDRWLDKREIVVQIMPNGKKTDYYSPFFQYIELLVSVGLLRRAGDGKWVRNTNILSRNERSMKER